MDSKKTGGCILSPFSRRPLFAAAVCFASGIVLGKHVDFRTAYIIAAAVFAAAAYVFRRKAALPLFCASALFLAAFLCAGAANVSYVKTGEGLKVEGRVYDAPYKNDYGGTVCFLDEASIDGLKCANIKLYVSGENAIECGDAVIATADVEIPKGVRNPGGFDERLYLLSQGISYKAYADAVTITGQRTSPPVFFSQARKYLGDTVDSIFDPETAPLAKAMLLGDKQGMDEETLTAFKDTGMAHVLAVSGLHAGILIAFIYFLLKALRAGRTARLLATLVFIAAYACLAGLTPSILRASVMAVALLTGSHFGRQNDALNFLSLAFVVTLVLKPLDLFTAGFQLSYAAVFGMLTLGGQIRRLCNAALPERMPRVAEKITRYAGGAVSASVGATAGTAPVLASVFNRIPTLGIILNLAVIPLASAAVVLVFAASLCGAVFGSAAAFAAFPAKIVLRIILVIVKWAAGLEFVSVSSASPPLYMTLAFFALLFVTSGYFICTLRIKTVFCAALVLLSALAALVFRFGGMYVAFLDVGQGNAAFIRTQQGGQYFIDGGGQNSSGEVVSFAVRNGCRIGAAFVSHTDSDHFAGITALYREGLLKKAYCTYQQLDAVKEAMPDAEVVPLSAGDTVILDDFTTALVLYPYRDTVSSDENDLSLVLLVEYAGHSALFTGDISGETETEIFARLRDVDIYEAAHHGSGRSSYRLPLSVLRPEHSVVSVGKNSFGQPSPLAISNLEDYSGKVYNTLYDYAVEFYIAEGVRVNTYGGGYE
mgnify:CR=1 FL=1